jgi:hypothetical protein
MQRRRLLIQTTVVAVAVLLLVGGWWFSPRGAESLGRGADTTSEQARRHSDWTANGASDASGPGSGSARDLANRRTSESPPVERETTFDRAKRDALRTEILEAVAKRPPRAPRTSAAAPSDDEPREPGTLQDMIGGRDALAERLNHDFMPLVDECIEQARVRLPELAGVVSIELETVADEELGGIVESVRKAPHSEIHDPELLECISETALSMVLPPPPEGGREGLVIEMRIEPDSEPE